MMRMSAYDATKDDGVFYAESYREVLHIEIKHPSRDPVGIYLDEQAVRDLARICKMYLEDREARQ